MEHSYIPDMAQKVHRGAMKKEVLMLLAACILFLILLETTLRIFFPQGLNFYSYNKDYVFEYRPYAVLNYERPDFKEEIHFNSQGFRDKERNYFTKNNSYRIAFIGDSFVSAFEVKQDERASDILEKKLNSLKSKNYEVFNLGVGGFSTEQELLQLKKKIINYEPNLIVLNYYIGNDQTDNYNRRIFLFENSTLSINKKRELNTLWPRRIFYFLTGKSHAVSFLFNNFLRARTAVSEEKTEIGALPAKEFIETSLMNTQLSQKVYDKTKALIKEMSEFLKANNKRFIVVLIPDRVQENKNEFDNVLNKLNITQRGINKLKPQQELKEFFEKEKIDYVDLLPALQNKTTEIHYLQDFHWNKKGHEIAAEEIFNYLNSHSIP